MPRTLRQAIIGCVPAGKRDTEQRQANPLQESSMADQTPRITAASEAAFLKAKQLMPGGVSSPVRAFKAVGGTPLFIRSGAGASITDIDGNVYIDYVASYGPLIAGHANERVVAALSKAIGRGTSFGATTESETQLASMIIESIPSIEMVRFVNSGTEATMSAIRLARAATQRELIVKCIGCYHGHADGLLVQAGSGALTLGTPSSPGVPLSIAGCTLLAHFNDLNGTRALFDQYKGRIACFIVEPVAGNMGVVPPAEGYLTGLRALCDEHGVLLLFDEVMTGFRVASAGAESLSGSAGPHMPWKSHRRRTSLRRIRRVPRPDGTHQPIGKRLSGRHAQRQSARHGRRNRHAGNSPRSGRLRGP